MCEKGRDRENHGKSWQSKPYPGPDSGTGVTGQFPCSYLQAALNKAVALNAQASMQAWAGMPLVCVPHVDVSSRPWRLCMHSLWVKEGQPTDQGADFWDRLAPPRDPQLQAGQE